MRNRKRRLSVLTIILGIVIAIVCILQGLLAFHFLPDTSSSADISSSGMLLLLERAIVGVGGQAPFSSSRPRPRSRPLLPFEQVWKDYQQQHSQQALLLELRGSDKKDDSENGNRTYQVIYYSCPHAAGNVLHDLFNQVVVAIVMNRTMLWKYNDRDTCQATRKGFGGMMCQKANTAVDCQRSLQLRAEASWVPLYDDWAATLNITSLPLRDPKAYSIDDWSRRRGQTTKAVSVTALPPMVYQTTKEQLWRYLPFLLGEFQWTAGQHYFESIVFIGSGRLVWHALSQTLSIGARDYPTRISTK
jgi:hypothetical protein